MQIHSPPIEESLDVVNKPLGYPVMFQSFQGPLACSQLRIGVANGFCIYSARKLPQQSSTLFPEP
jgi:hypothetical protein